MLSLRFERLFSFRPVLALPILVMTLWAQAAKIQDVQNDSSVSSDSKTIDLIFSVTEVQTSQLSAAFTTEQRHITIKIPKSDSNPILLAENSEFQTKANNSFYWKFSAVPRQETIGTSITVYYQIRIYENELYTDRKPLTDYIETQDSTKGVFVTVAFNEASGETFTQDGILENVHIKQVTAKPNVAPELTGTQSVHKGITIKWNSNKTVQYTVESISKIPGKVLVMLFSGKEANLTLKGKTCLGSDLNNPATARETCANVADTECTFDGNGDDQSCISCVSADGSEDPYAYVASEQPDYDKSVLDFRLGDNTLSSGVGTYTFTNLNPDNEYYIALSYLEGVKRTSCFKVTPTVTVSLSEANGEEDAKPGDPRCFIVSATYGDVHHPHITAFRWFRDAFLLKHETGRRFVSWYYENSPPVADAIAGNENWRLIARTVLWLPTLTLLCIKAFCDSPNLFLTLLLCGLAFFIVFSKTRTGAKKANK